MPPENTPLGDNLGTAATKNISKSPKGKTTVYIFGQWDLSFGTFDSFLAGLGRNQVYGACCPAQTAYKPV